MLNINHRELKTRRFNHLTRALGGREDIALGILTHLWLRCLHDKVKSFAVGACHDYLVCPPDDAHRTLAALCAAKYLKLEGDALVVVDVAPWIDRAHIRLARAIKAGQKSVKARAQKKLAAKRSSKLPATRLVSSATENQEAARACWQAYAEAYERLFGVSPVRNVKINSLIVQLIKRIPMTDAPAVLRFYVGHGNSFYAQRMYPLDLAVKDAESLHTQWKLNKPITKATIEKFNQREKMRDALEEGVIF